MKDIKEFIKELNFTTPAENEFLELSKKYNLSGVIVPSNWILQINEKIKSDKYIFYSLQ